MEFSWVITYVHTYIHTYLWNSNADFQEYGMAHNVWYESSKISKIPMTMSRVNLPSLGTPAAKRTLRFQSKNGKFERNRPDYLVVIHMDVPFYAFQEVVFKPILSIK